MNYLEDNHLDLKQQRKAHRIVGRIIVELEAQAAADIERRIQIRILPVRQRILDFWADFHNDANGLHSDSGNPSAGGNTLPPPMEPTDPTAPAE